MVQNFIRQFKLIDRHFLSGVLEVCLLGDKNEPFKSHSGFILPRHGRCRFRQRHPDVTG